MTDDFAGRPLGRADMETALAMMVEEQRKLADLQRRIGQASTTVDSANRMVTATFDGRGELTRLVFNNSKYRTMAPTELATILTDVLKRGRGQAIDGLSAMAGGEIVPGVSFGDLSAGKADLNEVVGKLVTATFGSLPGVLSRVQKTAGESVQKANSDG
ncbi:YbaB/EbfC family nucleoid-associated protein [Micromonospora chokoriensis]